MPYLYRAYGLTVETGLKLPELEALPPQSRVAPDVAIDFGFVSPDGLEGGRCLARWLWTAPGQLWLDVPTVARFLIRHGREVLVDPFPGADDASLRLFLLGSAFGALLIQRDLLVLHGNAVRIGDHCLICVGHSGAGKSTMAAGLMKRGYPVLADDVVPVDAQGRALPGFPRIKLWRDSADQLGIETADLDRIRPDIEKFNMPIAAAVKEPLPVRWIYELGHDRPEGIAITPVGGVERYALLHRNRYRPRFAADAALKRTHLTLAGNLAGRIHVARVASPRQAFELDALIDRLLADAAAHG